MAHNTFQRLSDLLRRQTRSTTFCYHVDIAAVTKQRLVQTKMLSHQPLDTIAYHGTPNSLAYRNPQAQNSETISAVQYHKIIAVHPFATLRHSLKISTPQKPLCFF